MVVGGPEWTTDGQEFVADWELCRSRCRKCGEIYNERLVIHEHRPVFELLDHTLPTLYVLPGGYLSPRGRFQFHNQLPDECEFYTTLYHYYRKDDASLLLLVEAGEIQTINTRRYTNPDLWPDMVFDSTNQCYTGCIGTAEMDHSTVYMAVDARFSPLPDFYQRWTTHRRCEEVQYVHTFKVGCTEIEVDSLHNEVKVGEWSCQILPADHSWEGTTREFNRSGKTAPVDIEILDRYYIELLQRFETLNVDFYLECEETEDQDYPSTGRVAFKWHK